MHIMEVDFRPISMFLIVIILLDLKLVSSVVDDQPYCSVRYRRLCQGKGQHVACQFTSPGPGLSCHNYSQIEFTSDLRHFITNYINRRRQRIASGNERVRGGARLPRPEVMMIVGWDRELAHLAQRLADQCHFVHDDCRATVRFPYAGQSVGEVRWRRSRVSDEMSSQRAIRRVLDAWWGEKRRVLPKQLIIPFRPANKGTVWGHFSQLAVWTLRAVGCGAVRHGLEYSRLLLVCDFSHTNMLGQRTINPGPLIACPMHTARRPRTSYPLLCAPVRRPTTPDTANQENKDYYGVEDKDDEINYTFDDTTTARVKKVKTHTKARDTVSYKYNHEYKTTMEDEYETVKLSDDRRISYLAKVQKKTTYSIIDRLQLELESNNNKQQQPIKIYPTEGYTKVARIPYLERLRENLEFREETYPKKAVPTYEDDDETPEYKLLRTKMNQDFNSKQRWKQTRSRPQRPGVNALLNRAPEKNLKRSSFYSLMLDKEDIDQLFQDTGFKVKHPLNQ